MLRYHSRAQEPAWPCPPDMSPVLWRLLSARGVNSPEEAQAFLHPDVNQLLSPLSLQDMDKAVHRVRQAAWRKEKVGVWGDYDVDGVCASAIMHFALEAMGLSPIVYLPSRHQEGYGLNEKGIRQMASEGVSLLITVDCGVTAVELVTLAQSLGMDVIVTDHHKPPEQLPSCPVVNPLLGDYENRALCGAGVAFKLALALNPQMVMELIDLAALATVADVVSLLGENRVIVSLGLEKMNANPRPGIYALWESAGLFPNPIKSSHLGFQFGPRLNAGGRIGSAQDAFDLMTSQTPEEARPIAQQLETQNQLRREEEQQILTQAENQLAAMDLSRMWAIVLAGEWNVGVVGLAAGRLVEKYHLPTVLLSRQGDTLTGSCRSIPGVDIHLMLTKVSHLLTRFGGHNQAAGLTMPGENLDSFREELNSAISLSTPPEVLIPSMDYDWEGDLDCIDEELVSLLEKTQPWGYGNPTPVLRCQGKMLWAKGVGKEGSHLSFSFSQKDTTLGGIYFSQGHRADELSGQECDLLFSPGFNSFRGKTSIQLQARSAIAAHSQARLHQAGAQRLPLLHGFLTNALYNGILSIAPPQDISSLKKAMESDPRGTLILCADEDIALSLLKDLAAGHTPLPDVCVGSYPQDSRCWNALCLLPQGQIPSGYGQIWVAGAPGWLVPGGRALAGYRAKWLRTLPDVESLRALYQASRALLTADLSFPSPWALCRALSEKTGMAAEGCLAGLMVLDQMQLLSFSVSPFRAAMLPMHKADPKDFSLFQKLTQLRTWEVDAVDEQPAALR